MDIYFQQGVFILPWSGAQSYQAFSHIGSSPMVDRQLEKLLKFPAVALRRFKEQTKHIALQPWTLKELCLKYQSL